MVEVYAILGASHTRKSSTIRALTGAYEAGSWRVSLAAADREGHAVYVQISALQEARKEAQDFIDDVRRTGCRFTLVPLRVDAVQTRVAPRRYFPAGVDYLQEFDEAGWHVRSVVMLGQRMIELPVDVGHTWDSPGARTEPANWIASEIRAEWGWL